MEDCEKSLALRKINLDELAKTLDRISVDIANLHSLYSRIFCEWCNDMAKNDLVQGPKKPLC